MKKIVITLFALVVSTNLIAQNINNVPLNEINEEYILMDGYCRSHKKGWNIMLDYGQKTGYWTDDKERMLRKGEEPMCFDSMIEALNFMYGYGYELLSSDPTKLEKEGTVIYSYLLRKKKKE